MIDLEKVKRDRERQAAIQRECVQRCYRPYKDANFDYMWNECPRHKRNISDGSEEPLTICSIFSGIVNNVKKAKAGVKLDDGITYGFALEEIAKLGLEEIPREAYGGVTD